MKIKLIFYDWFRNGKSLANTTEGVNLSICDFHAGSTFDGDIELNEQQSKILKSKGINRSVFQ